MIGSINGQMLISNYQNVGIRAGTNKNDGAKEVNFSDFFSLGNESEVGKSQKEPIRNYTDFLRWIIDQLYAKQLEELEDLLDKINAAVANDKYESEIDKSKFPDCLKRFAATEGVNLNTASAEDVLSLIKKLQEKIQDKITELLEQYAKGCSKKNSSEEYDDTNGGWTLIFDF